MAKSLNIAKATKQQTRDIESIVETIQSIVVIAEETAAGTEQIASSAESLSEGMEKYSSKSKNVLGIVNQLTQKVERFKLS
ncbi:hypothetical protein BFP72_09530 [Reichenbachiella sp. 5M10]|nr:hypothetical protein BFP72_09530 [Reichenbachiella sp. 5M10]